MDKKKRRIVVKVGTSTLTYETGRTNIRRMGCLVRVLSDIVNRGDQVVLVSSGAIAIGCGKLGLKTRPTDTQGRQAVSTVGQCELMFMYDKLFDEYTHPVGQLLVTKTDVDDNERRGNLINAFESLLELGVVPIVNENDSVAVEEIVYGDNDCLSAIVAKLIKADVLIMITDKDGLYDSDPAVNADARLIGVVEEITADMEKVAGGAGSSRGTGGMITKIHAARIATEAGIPTYIINGADVENIYRVLDGEPVGTCFLAKKQAAPAAF